MFRIKGIAADNTFIALSIWHQFVVFAHYILVTTNSNGVVIFGVIESIIL